MLSPDQEVICCSIWRGGTSKGLFLLENELPTPGLNRDKKILRLFGSPDNRQIDGLGGADPLTSKVAVIGPSTRDDADVDYIYGMVSINKSIVSWKGNCGNISAAVGPFAIDKGLVHACEPITSVRINCVNTENIIVAKVPVRNGKPLCKGEYQIDGVPGTGAKIEIDYAQTVGSSTGKLIPTGNIRETLSVEDFGDIDISIVDIANPEVFIKAKDVGLTGSELPHEVNENHALIELLEKVRGHAAVNIGLASDWKKAFKETPNIPHLVLVAPPMDYYSISGNFISKDKIHINCRVIFMQKMHKAYPGTGSVCTSVATLIPKTIPNEMAALGDGKVVIGHPSGTLSIISKLEKKGGNVWLVKEAVIARTARKLMEGLAYI